MRYPIYSTSQACHYEMHDVSQGHRAYRGITMGDTELLIPINTDKYRYNKSPLPLTDPREAVTHAHRVIRRCRWSVW